ncbi:hypothetical protein FQR65_LT02061 [Abscondita terminalis]|nr:hypothetical protein FQR65_LT02061 [Abscondita terminalis]
MDVKPLIKPFGYVSSCLAIVQGVTWTIFSILTILIHTKTWIIKFDGQNSTHAELLGVTIVLGYIVVILVLVKNQNRDYKKCLLALGIWTIVVCVADLVLTALLAKDYNTLVRYYNQNKTDIYDVYDVLSCGVLMSIVARGYVMWVVNIVLAIVLLILFLRLPKKFDSLRNEYSTTSVAVLKNPNEQSRRQRYDSEISFGTFQGLPRVPPVQSINNELKAEHNSFVTGLRSSMYPSFSYNPRQKILSIL